MRRAGAANKGAEWGGERVRRGSVPGPLPEDPGGRKPECHLNSARGAGAWDSSAAVFSNNGWSASSKLRESRPGRRTTARPLRPRSWPLETPAVAWHWPGNSRMKSKKGKARGRRAPWARVPGQRARRAARVTRTFPPRGARRPEPRPSSLWKLRLERPLLFSFQTQHEGLLWGDGPLHAAGTLSRSTLRALFVRLQVSLSPNRHPTLRRAAAWLLAGGGVGSRVGGYPRPAFLRRDPGWPGPRSLGALSESWAPGLPTRSRQSPGTTSPGMGRFHLRRNATLDPRSPPGVGPFGKFYFPEFLASQKFSHDESGARGRVRTEGVQ